MGWPSDMGWKGCELIECWTHVVTFNVSPMTLILDFQGQIMKMVYLRNGMADWHGAKGMWVDRMLHPLCDFQLWPQPWPWPWIFKVKFWKNRISGMGWPIDMGWKGCESIECESIKCWTHVVTFNFPSPMTFTLDFQGQILKMLYLRNGMADWHGIKVMWVDRMIDSHYDFKVWPHPWPWPWIFKVKYWNCCNSGMGGLTHLEWKGCELDMMLDAQWDCRPPGEFQRKKSFLKRLIFTEKRLKKVCQSQDLAIKICRQIQKCSLWSGLVTLRQGFNQRFVFLGFFFFSGKFWCRTRWCRMMWRASTYCMWREQKGSPCHGWASGVLPGNFFCKYKLWEGHYRAILKAPGKKG